MTNKYLLCAQFTSNGLNTFVIVLVSLQVGNLKYWVKDKMRGYNALQSSGKFFQNNEVNGDVESQKAGRKLTGKKPKQQERSDSIRNQGRH